MSFLDKIVKPAATPEEIEKIISKPEIAAVPGETEKRDSVEAGGQAVLPGSAPISETPLEFKPIPEEIIPPLINENPVITSAPPLSEDDAPTAGGEPVSALPADGANSNPDSQSGGNEPANPEAVKRGRGRPPGSTSKPRPPEILTAGADPEKQLEAVAGMTFDMSTGALALILGEEWNPKSKAERDFVVTAIANYYRATGTVDLPPGWTLAFVVSAYSLPRMTQPKTKEKLAATWYWIKTKIAGVFPKRKK